MATIENLLHRRTDLSTFIVHFTRDTDHASAQESLVSILRTFQLEARTAYGMARVLAEQHPEVAPTQRVVCFTETPLEHAWMMCSDIDSRRDMKFRGYGLAFTKTFARRRGANPVWYLDITPGHDWLTTPVNELVNKAKLSMPDGDEASDLAEFLASPILRLTPFIEQMGPMTAGGRKEFWWEREWRLVGDLLFNQNDIVVVFAPHTEHETLRAVLRESGRYGDGLMPAFVDATWGLERMIGTLAGVQELGPFPQ